MFPRTNVLVSHFNLIEGIDILIDLERPSIIDRISSYSVRGTYARFASRKLEGTTLWLSENQKLREWLASECSAELFLTGKGTYISRYISDSTNVARSGLRQDYCNVSDTRYITLGSC